MPSRKVEFCPHRKRLGENVAALRARRNLTQEELAEKVDVSPRYVQSVEAGEYFPRLPTLVRLRAPDVIHFAEEGASSMTTVLMKWLDPSLDNANGTRKPPAAKPAPPVAETEHLPRLAVAHPETARQ